MKAALQHLPWLGRAAGISAASLLLVFLASSHARAAATDTPIITLRCETSPANHAADLAPPDSWGPWLTWARLDNANAYTPDIPRRDALRALASRDRADRAGVVLSDTSDSLLRVRIEMHLAAGLWRVDAALLKSMPPVIAPGSPHTVGADAAPAPASTVWRMERVWQRSAGFSVKTVDLKPGETLFLRWTETVAEADRARQNAHRACWKSNNGTMQNRISPALEQAGEVIDSLPDAVEAGDRDKIVKRLHIALLAVAKAQAVWQNWREESASDGDPAFDALTRALSEISCAACNLTPSQNPVLGDDGRIKGIRLSVTNGGSRTVPLISLGLPRRADGGGGSPPASDRRIFRDLLPGGRVAAEFPAAEETSGAIQFIFGNGTAVVPARPEGAPPSPATDTTAP